MSSPKDPELKPPAPPMIRDPFPNLSFARKYLWNFLDQNAYRRVLRLGVPGPWQAYEMGYRAAKMENELEQARRLRSGSDVDLHLTV